MTIFITVGQVIWIIFVIVFFYIPLPNSKDIQVRLKNNAKRLSSLYGDLKVESKMNLLMPLIFMAKRISFSIGVFLIKNASINIPIFIITTTLNLAVVLNYAPFKQERMNRFEVFNEITSIIFCIILQAFTGDLVGSKADKYLIGWISITIFMIYIFTHLSF